MYYGWILVATLGVTETISWGVLYYAFTVYLAPMQADLGWSRGEMTGAFSLGSLVAGLAAILYDPAFATAAVWFERYRVRALTLITLLAGFASTIFIPLAVLLVQRQGWRSP